MTIDEVVEKIKSFETAPKILILDKKYYFHHKKKIDDIMKNNPAFDLLISDILDFNTDAVIMNKAEYYNDYVFRCKGE